MPKKTKKVEDLNKYFINAERIPYFPKPKKPKIGDYRDSEEYKVDLDNYYNDLEIYCAELEKKVDRGLEAIGTDLNKCREIQEQKDKVVKKAVNAMYKVGCEECPKYNYCCKHHTSTRDCKSVLRKYFEK